MVCAIVLARVVHGREVAAGNEGDFVAVAIVIGGEELAGFLVFLARVVERQPADGPGHFAIGAAACKGFAAGADALGAIVDGFVFADGCGWA